jgi:hypothetical protein
MGLGLVGVVAQDRPAALQQPLDHRRGAHRRPGFEALQRRLSALGFPDAQRGVDQVGGRGHRDRGQGTRVQLLEMLDRRAGVAQAELELAEREPGLLDCVGELGREGALHGRLGVTTAVGLVAALRGDPRPYREQPGHVVLVAVAGSQLETLVDAGRRRGEPALADLCDHEQRVGADQARHRAAQARVLQPPGRHLARPCIVAHEGVHEGVQDHRAVGVEPRADLDRLVEVLARLGRLPGQDRARSRHHGAREPTVLARCRDRVERGLHLVDDPLDSPALERGEHDPDEDLSRILRREVGDRRAGGPQVVAPLPGRAATAGVAGQHEVHERDVDRIGDVRARALDQRERGVRTAPVLCRLRGQAEPMTAPGGVHAQLRGSLERGRGARLRAPRHGLHAGGLELGGEALVGRLRDQRAVPGAAGRVVHDRAERLVGRFAVGSARRAVDRRAHQRVAERHRAVQSDQPAALGLGEVRAIEAEALGRQLDGGEVAGLVGGGEQQQPPGRLGQAGDAGAERLFHSRAHGRRAEDRLGTGQLVLAQRGRQLEQRERIAARRRHEARQDVGRRHPVEPIGEESVGVVVAERLQGELGDAGRREGPEVPLAHGHDHGDRLSLESARGEHERLGRGTIQPLRVVDAAEQRTLLAGLGEQAEQAERDEEAVLDALGGQAEGTLHRGRLRRGQAVDQIETRADELVHARERQLVLGLDADAAQHAHVGRLALGVLEQRGLADARLPAQDHDRTAFVARALKQRVQFALLSLSAHQHVGGDRNRGPQSRTRGLPDSSEPDRP